MAETKINYEYDIFVINISKEGDFYRVKCDGLNPLKFNLIINDIQNKKFIVIESAELSDKKSLIDNIDFNQLLEFIDKGEYSEISIEVINPNNVINIENNNYEINILAKNPENYREEIIKSLINLFDYAQNYKGYKYFIDFLKTALEDGYNIMEDEEFPGTMLKFYKNKKLLKSIYIKDEKIEFVEFTQKYKELQISNIKESLEKLNEKLELEGNKKIGLEFKEDG